MENLRDRRRWPRQILPAPEVCFLNMDDMTKQPKFALNELSGSLYVDICDVSQGGVLIKSEKKIESNALLYLNIYNSSEKLWKFCQGSVKWIKSDSAEPDSYQIGVEIQQSDPKIKAAGHEDERYKQTPPPTDYEFFRSTRLLRSIPRTAVCTLLNSVSYKHLKAGERLMAQGEIGDTFFIIQSGSCVATVEKDGELHPVARLREGDIVGEMAIVTGEARNANVDAETNMELWYLTRSQFDDISKKYPELRAFLTELVADRFESRKITAHRTIGKYIITDIIGRGGYSIVYKGVHADLNMLVAVKMMKHNLAMNPDFLENFWNEAKIIASFNHDNIVRVYDIEELYRSVFIIMEFLEGESLNDMLRRLGTIPLPQAIDFLIQTCYGLDYAHQRQIVHQDIKAANLFIQKGGRMKILDFGIACPIGSEDQLFESTVYYISPEQLKCEAVDQRTDIYSLGITAYEMVTGKRPYPEDDLMALREIRINQEIPDPDTMAPDLPEELRQFIIKACRRNPDQRYQNVGQALVELHQLADKFKLKRRDLSLGKQKMTTLYLMYKDGHRQALAQIVKAFSDSIQRPGVIQQMANLQLEKYKMTTIFMIYKDFHQKALNKRIEELSTQVKEIGVIQKASDFQCF